MTDIISINRQFLIMARDAANTKSGELVTGLPRHVLEQLSRLTVDQIDAIARHSGISLISCRLSEAEINRLVALDEAKRPSYLLNVAATEGR